MLVGAYWADTLNLRPFWWTEYAPFSVEPIYTQRVNLSRFSKV
jgi:hypothetical protein